MGILARVDVEFADKVLEWIETDQAAAKTKLPIAVIAACRKKLSFIRDAPDERTLRNWKSLRYEKLQGEREGQSSIRLNDQWRLVFKIDNTSSPPKMTVLSVEDYH
jgi:proteic killer suppression protein